MNPLRAIPSVEKVLQTLGPSDLPRPSVTALVRRELAACRSEREIPSPEAILARVRQSLEALRQSRIQPVINGTGIVIHTNLGRAPLGAEVVEQVARIASSYNTLEFDLTSGGRGSRGSYLEGNLALLCAAEAAAVVNNCAAALVLILRHFTAGPRKEVIISRGELVQIGGGFRIPDILEASGARLREVGATNKTSIEDYARAISRDTAMILKVHRSNFVMEGFVASPTTQELARLAQEHQLPLIEDLGSGAAVPTEKIAALPHEPTPAEVLECGVALVCFSGDKLLGGPQAGIIAGRAELVENLKREPFYRALRCDKLILTALQATVDLYLRARSGETMPDLPVLGMLAIHPDVLRARAQAIEAALEGLPVQVTVGRGETEVGGGTLPRSGIESVTLDLQPRHLRLEEFAARLRQASPPVLGYISEGLLRLDLRTIFPHQDQTVAAVLRSVLEPS